MVTSPVVMAPVVRASMAPSLLVWQLVGDGNGWGIRSQWLAVSCHGCHGLDTGIKTYRLVGGWESSIHVKLGFIHYGINYDYDYPLCYHYP